MIASSKGETGMAVRGEWLTRVPGTSEVVTVVIPLTLLPSYISFMGSLSLSFSCFFFFLYASQSYSTNMT